MIEQAKKIFGKGRWHGSLPLDSCRVGLMPTTEGVGQHETNGSAAK
jgi:hypothetical protein